MRTDDGQDENRGATSMLMDEALAEDRDAAADAPAPEHACARLDDLRAVPLFASLSDANLTSLARSVRRRQASVGDVLCREGERGDEMYVILRGAVTLHKSTDGRDTELGRLESGAHFGEMALIGESPRSATIVADGKVDYLAIDRDTLMSVISAYPTVALQILRGYNERLANTTERLARLSAHLADRRLPTAEHSDVSVLDPDALLRHRIEQVVLFGPHPLAVLARRLLVEVRWDRKVLLALDVYELTVKYTVFLLLADYLRRPAIRSPEVDQMVVAAFRRPTLGLLLDMCPRLLKAFTSHGEEPFVPGLAALHLRPEGGRSESGRALHALTSYRNRLKHGAEGVWDDETFLADFEGAPEERLPNGDRRLGLKHHLSAVLQAVDFLRDFPLVYVTSMTYEHGAFEYAYERCIGAYTSFDRGVFAGREPLENRRLYVLSQQDERAMPLDPFLKRLRCPTCATSAVFLLFSATPDRERARKDAASDGDARIRRKERLEYLSHACGHTLTEQLTAERIERGEGISHLFE
jgi:CRP-like cAMP-binding protein